MLSEYGYVGILLVVAVLFTVIIPLLPLLLSFIGLVPRKSNPAKTSTYECGMQTIGKTWVQFNFRYYFYALIFLALDILVVFLYPWAVQLRELGPSSLIVVLILVFIVLIGYIYAWQKKALEWK